MKLSDIIYNLIFVPRCASCRVRLDPLVKSLMLHEKACLCERCLEDWQRAKSGMCHTCYMSADKCFCMPKQKPFDQPYIPSLFFYHPDTSRSENRVIYTAKHKNPTLLFEFLAAELEGNIYALLRDTTTSKDNCILTWIPRSKHSERKYGVDQARELCLKLADKTGIAAHPLLIRARGGKEQKKLDGKRDRQKNVDNSVFLNERYIAACKRKEVNVIDGKTVLVIDDIITTGASMHRALSLVKSAGAERAMACCVARSQVKSKPSQNNQIS